MGGGLELSLFLFWVLNFSTASLKMEEGFLTNLLELRFQEKKKKKTWLMKSKVLCYCLSESYDQGSCLCWVYSGEARLRQGHGLWPYAQLCWFYSSTLLKDADYLLHKIIPGSSATFLHSLSRNSRCSSVVVSNEKGKFWSLRLSPRKPVQQSLTLAGVTTLPSH